MWGNPKRFVPVSFSTSRRIHRWSGRVALLLTLPVIFHCVIILGFETTDLPVTVHSITGSFVYGVVAAKPLVSQHHSRNYPSRGLLGLGGTLAAVLTTLWLTSSFWYFTNVRFGF